MACAAAVPITFCPPSTSFEHYDQHQFVRLSRPVGVRYAGGDRWENPSGLSFDDFRVCQTSSRKLFASRRYVTPDWATADKKLQRVIVEYLIQRACGSSTLTRARMPKGKPIEQLRWAEQRLREKVPGLERVLNGLCEDYVELKQRGIKHPYLRTVEALIQNNDTSIIINRGAGKIIAAVVYMYYREGLNSVSIAEALGLSAPGVRQLLFRIWQVAKQLGYTVEPFRAQRNQQTIFKSEATGEIVEAVRPARARAALAAAAEIHKADDRWSAENLAAYRAKKATVAKPPARAVTPAIETSRAERAAYVERYRAQNAPAPKVSDTRAARRSRGLCGCGKVPDPPFKTCATCREYANAHNAPRLAAAKAERAKNPVPKEVWKAKLAAAQRASWARKKAERAARAEKRVPTHSSSSSAVTASSGEMVGTALPAKKSAIIF